MPAPSSSSGCFVYADSHGHICVAPPSTPPTRPTADHNTRWRCPGCHTLLRCGCRTNDPTSTDAAAEKWWCSSSSPLSPLAPHDDATAQWALRRLVLCGTHPETDWKEVEDLLAQEQPQRGGDGCGGDHAGPTPLPFCIGGFGVHPWFLQPTLAENVPYLHQLEVMLQRYPTAIVAEIGLDALKGPPLDTVQVPFFAAQLRLAAAYGRPVSMHCVRAYPILQRLFTGGSTLPSGAEATPTPSSQGDAHGPSSSASSPYLSTAPLGPEDIPPAIVLHGFSGSIEIAKALLKLRSLKSSSRGGPARVGRVCVSDRLFFGLGARTTLRLKGFREALLPLLWATGRVLVESDAFYHAAASAGEEGPAAISSWHAPVEESVESMAAVLAALEAQEAATAAGSDPRRGPTGTPMDFSAVTDAAQRMEPVEGGQGADVASAAAAVQARLEMAFKKAFSPVGSSPSG